MNIIPSLVLYFREESKKTDDYLILSYEEQRIFWQRHKNQSAFVTTFQAKDPFR